MRFLARLTAALLALVAVLGLAGTGAWSQRRELAQWFALRELARLGVAPASLEVPRFEINRLELRALRAGAGDALVIDEIDVEYTLADLWRGRVAALRVSGVRIAGEIAAEGPRFGGLEALGAGEAKEDRADRPLALLRLPVLPSNQLVIENARAEIATLQGPLAIVLSVDARDAEGRTHAHADLVAHHALADATAKLEMSGVGDSVTGGAALGLVMAPGAGLGLPVSAGRVALAAKIEISGPEILVSFTPGHFALTVGEGKDALRLEGSTPKAELRTQLDEDGSLAPLALETSGGDLRAPTLGVAARGFDLDLKIELPDRLEGRIGLRELKDSRKPARAPSFRLAGHLKPIRSGHAFDLVATEKKKRVVLHAKGKFDAPAGSADAQLRLEPVLFAKDGLQPAQLFPELGGRVSAVSGTLEAAGSARFSGGRSQLVIDLAARDLGFETPLAQVEGVNGTLRVEGPDPISTPPKQLVSIGRIGFGLDLTNGLVAGQLRPDGVIAIDKAEWQTLGGRVHTAGSLDPKARHQPLLLEADGLDLAKVLALVDLEGLSGEGRLDGRIPIDRSAEAIEIRGGVIRARPGARIRYQPAPGVASLEHSAAGFDLLLGAFENLECEKLAVELDGDANGPMKVVLKVVGANPEFQGGRPIHYNLSIESRLADLLQKGTAAYRVPQEIEKRLEKFGQGAR
jgi:hypothetical protein